MFTFATNFESAVRAEAKTKTGDIAALDGPFCIVNPSGPSWYERTEAPDALYVMFVKRSRMSQVFSAVNAGDTCKLICLDVPIRPHYFFRSQTTNK